MIANFKIAVKLVYNGFVTLMCNDYFELIQCCQ